MGPTLSRAQRYGSVVGKAGGAKDRNEANGKGWNGAALASRNRQHLIF